jgi:hypothetical protein
VSDDITVVRDKKNVYLEINDVSECCFELWEMPNDKKSSVKIKIPIESWEKIIKEWRDKK